MQDAAIQTGPMAASTPPETAWGRSWSTFLSRWALLAPLAIMGLYMMAMVVIGLGVGDTSVPQEAAIRAREAGLG